MILSSCSTKKSVIGLYGKCEKKYLACTQIELKSDNTFEYYVFMDVGGSSIIKGNWIKTAHNTIFLSTFNQPNVGKTTYSGKINPKLKNKIKITVSDFEKTIESAGIILNNSREGKVTDYNGIAEFQSQNIHSITYAYLGLEETIEIDNPNYNEIKITIKDLELNAVPKFMNDKKVLFRNNNLIFNPNKHWSMFTLKKTRMINKQWN